MVRSVYYHPEKGTKILEGVADFTPLIEETGSLLWVDMLNPTDEEAYCLTHDFQFHPLAVEDVVTRQHSPKVDEFSDHLFIVFHTAFYNPGEEGLGSDEIYVFFSDKYVVTARYKDFKSLENLFTRATKDERILKRGADFLLHNILDYLVDDYNNALKLFDHNIQELEEEVFHDPGKEMLRRIYELKEDIIHLKQIVSPQRDILRSFTGARYSLIGPDTYIYFRDVYDHLTEVDYRANSYRDLLASVLEAYFSSVSQKTNEIMRILTVFASIFIPLTFITSLYGMNFAFMPELQWKWGYFAVIGLCVAVTALLFIYFKRKKWL
ncbi:MAG: magnesium/cobalt transporter CorA [candidate division Zixibacteria bacterium]|nr:magnesium/cobalt transporter CorA [candidate division Zixibacteria bacterium]